MAFSIRQLIGLTFRQLKKVALRTTRRKVNKWVFLFSFSSLVVIFMFLIDGKPMLKWTDKIQSWWKCGCPKNFLPEEQTWKYGSCLPHQASNESCEKVRMLYELDPALTKCKALSSKRVCELKSLLKGPKDHVNFRVSCDNSICMEQNENETIQVLNMNPSNGQITEAGRYLNITDLEAALMVIIRENIKQKFHFVVLRCTSKDTKTGISQIIQIDPQLTMKENASKTRDQNLLNVNIVLIDSVSRAHFYRSLPKTIELFKRWRNESHLAPAMIFDFELFQAVHGHTTENTHALFNGRLLDFNRSASSQSSVNPGFMFGAFHRAGYQTMWQEDLCWKGIWGLMLDLLAGSWANLAKRLQEHFIDHSGLTHAGCEILEYVYGINTPFMGPPGDQICYDGRFHHSYLLQYTLDTIKAITSTPTALPLLSYMSLSVGHDHIGRRIQSLDPALVQFVTQLSMSEDTLTVILSDHGNTYTSYTSTLEGRFEMFHPHLFLIVPNKVAQRLGDEALDALRINQHRLVNIIDLHHSIMALTKPLHGPVTPTGLFTPISAQRTCQDIELRLPNLCVCEGWDNPTSNDDMKMILVEFALGYLNNQIETKLIKQTKENSTLQLYRTRSCNRLRATLFKEVRERRVASRGVLITSMLIYVPAGSGSGEDAFNVMVESRDVTAQRSLDLKFLQYDRMSMYGQYKACADRNILKLCMCSIQSQHKQQSLNITRLLAPPHPKYFGQESVSKISRSECIFVITRTHKSNISFAYEMANVCKYRSFFVSVDVQSTGMKLTRACPFNVTLLPDNIKFVLAARKEKLLQKSSIRFRAQIIKKLN